MRTLTLESLRLALFPAAIALAVLSAPQVAKAESPITSPGGYGNGAGYGDGYGYPGPYPYECYSTECSSPEDIHNSLTQIAGDRMKNLVAHDRLASPLLGGTEQINCGDCFRGFGMLGSYSAGFNGRKNLTGRLSVLGGLSYNQFDSKSAKTTRAPIFALGLRYDLADWGASRPFFQIAGSFSPGERVQTQRIVNFGGGPGVLVGSTDSTTLSLSARAGWVHRVSPVGELAAYVSFSRSQQRFGAYTERGNPALLPLAYSTRTASLNVVKGVVQHTQLLSPKIEAHVSAGVAHGFGAKSGIVAASGPFGVFTPAAKDTTWAELDARIGFRVMKGGVVDVFALTTLGPKPVGNSLHGGLGFRYLF